MSRVKTLQTLFKRYRRPGDIVFAWIILIVALLLLTQLYDQTAWRKGGPLFAQPRFWPAVSLTGMAGFAAFHLLGSALSERIHGRWQEVWLWLSSLEYAGWFIAYAAAVPYAGYLPATVFFAVALALRAGYRRPATLAITAASAGVIVLLFKTLLKVNLPAGRVYEALPDGLRQIMLTYF
ncbi:tripartite tricarboxylate transporter TctB family protein [Phaeobacter gallaeciensis]|uniref:Tripartite tricarboxylate transporter TctB family protein n=1 Tax=Phaeobacter gallaeciensis TaxID=60890 RepID=A0AAC9Z759_9RHOB|nr:tripartite tricarboxylate transporter TctB family protein [Phaeobacter gallaeciensis]AHD07824.1 Tripartite tricarboxylate transporter TctB family [Phaeobacter gallaeciensis DSM 26640]ATE91092.1 Tripartite tricarboxylate transporter TctB family protein [Phaeobacter gallaeciensis]ATE95367.1 Tripartite tricarboxylate transporter TctB family protein [Phaeobacter gallaeciensis]ATE99706.1 Tripartite tricarboxylate transporter TctB family protein [Phaeobacter gallaeciensis]ATF04139.1 Tripartite tr